MVWRLWYLFGLDKISRLKTILTGVRSRLSSSVAEAAASIKSSHRFPMMAAAVAGSAEYAFLS